MTKFKAEFDKVRKQIRKLQREADKKNVSSGADTLVSWFEIKCCLVSA